MSPKFEALLAVCIVLACVGVVLSGMGVAVYCHTVDFSQAKFEQGDIVVLKVGGVGQVLERSGHNEGSIWDLKPVFEYEVRQATQDGTRTQTYQEWELKPPC